MTQQIHAPIAMMCYLLSVAILWRIKTCPLGTWAKSGRNKKSKQPLRHTTGGFVDPSWVMENAKNVNKSSFAAQNCLARNGICLVTETNHHSGIYSHPREARTTSRDGSLYDM